VRVNDLLAVSAVGFVESVTLAVKLKEPDAVGVPEIVPADDNVRPAGKAPALRLQLYGVVPPLAASVIEYAVPTCPDGTEALVICTAVTAAATVRANDLVAVSAFGFGLVESVTWAVKLKEPDAVGVPEIVPAEDNVRPPGSAPALMLQLYGWVPPLAASVVEYAVPTRPDGTDVVVICTAATAAATVRVNDLVAVSAVGLVESVTLAVKLKEPDAVGVPEMVPAEDNVRPPGKAPEPMLQLYGVVPPLAASVIEYAVPTCPDGTDVVVICTAVTAAATVRVNDLVAVSAFGFGVVESVTFAVKLKEPEAVGVPEIVPADDNASPPGNAPALMLQLYGWVPPLAASVVEYAVPTCPDGTDTVVICSAVTAAATVRVNDLVAVSAFGFGVVESVTCAVKLKEPEAVGVPEIVPADDSVSPPGNAPALMLQLYGWVPPLAASVVEYAVPTCPDGTDTVVICSAVTAAATVRVNDLVAVSALGFGVVESVTCAVKLKEPDAVGVPEIVPADDNVRPAGKAPALRLQL
jgi:hypothetical protein